MGPHEILGVRPGAGRREVTDAYRRFALRHHPDRGGDRATFEAGVEAYRRLTGDRGDPTVAAATAGGRAPANVVFHRRRRPALAALLRRARGRGRRPAHRSLS